MFHTYQHLPPSSLPPAAASSSRQLSPRPPAAAAASSSRQLSPRPAAASSHPSRAKPGPSIWHCDASGHFADEGPYSVHMKLVVPYDTRFTTSFPVLNVTGDIDEDMLTVRKRMRELCLDAIPELTGWRKADAKRLELTLSLVAAPNNTDLPEVRNNSKRLAAAQKLNAIDEATLQVPKSTRVVYCKFSIKKDLYEYVDRILPNPLFDMNAPTPDVALPQAVRPPQRDVELDQMLQRIEEERNPVPRQSLTPATDTDLAQLDAFLQRIEEEERNPVPRQTPATDADLAQLDAFLSEYLV